jgi:ADP-dependent NAD(P)H-hydrate dehydratase / NAD(P)H-hydrate epimerase
MRKFLPLTLTRKQCRQLDQQAINHWAIPGAVLMENAGQKAAGIFQAQLKNIPRPKVLILCGPGNNGGDGLVIARYFHHQGIRCQILFLGYPSKVDLHSECGLNLKIIRQYPIPFRPVRHPRDWRHLRFNSFTAIIDALFGTGLCRPLRGAARQLIEEVNQHRRPKKWAVDIPSGLDADRGIILGAAFAAQLTVTFAALKKGMVKHPLCGKIEVVDIGIPPEVYQKVLGRSGQAQTMNS